MTIPAIASITPADASTTHSVQNPITVFLNTAILSSSVSHATITLIDEETAEVVDSSFSLSGSNIQIIPKSVLVEGRLYRVTIPGDDDDPVGGTILSADTSDPLASTFSITFRTQVERYVSIEEATTRDDFETSGPARVVSPETILSPTDRPWSQKAELAPVSPFTVSSSSPRNYKSSVPISTATVDITFVAAPSANFASYMTVEQVNVIGDEEAYAAQDSSGDNHLMLDEPTLTTVVYAPITGVFTSSGSTITWTPDDLLNFNTEFTFRIGEGLQSSDGTYESEQEQILVFTTEYWPLFVQVPGVRIIAGSVLNAIPDDTLKRIILANSIDIWELSGRAEDLNAPTRNAKKYVACKSIVDLMDMAMAMGQSMGGQSKQAGDFRVDYRGRGAKDPNLYEAKKQCAQDALNAILGENQRALPVSFVKSRNSVFTAPDMRRRLWSWPGDTFEPIGNRSGERERKVPAQFPNQSATAQKTTFWD